MAILSSDIYEINNFVNEVKKSYIDESDDTLSMGIFGYLGAMFSSMIQNNIIIGTEYINEMFPTKAKYEKFILEHAMTYNITDINAVPSTMNVTIGLVQSEIDALMDRNQFVLDKDSKIFIEEYEFHLEYDIIIAKSILSNAEVVYTARYAIDRDNPLSTVTNPYLSPPAIVNENGTKFIFVNCHIRQLELSTVYKKIITNNVIDNKTLMFTFDNQLASFDILIKEGGEEFYVTPLFEGVTADALAGRYCHYSYIGSDKIKVTFDSDVYQPSLNTDVTIILNTTQGADGNFVYNENVIMALESANYAYTNLSTMIIPTGDAEYGVDRKSVSELRKLVPKEALSRGSITSNADLENYFNSIDSDTNKLTFVKKVDNQIERTYYAYLLLKDSLDLVIPTNTIPLRLKASDFSSIEEGRLAIRPGTLIGYNGEYGFIIPYNTLAPEIVESEYYLYADPDNANTVEIDPVTPEEELLLRQDIPVRGDNIYIDRITGELTSKRYTTTDCLFMYTTPFLIVANHDPLYTSFYLNLINKKYNLNFDYINDQSEIQFISTTVTFKRKFNADNDIYTLTIKATQNIKSDKGLVTVDDDNNILTSNVKIIAMLYNEEGVPYRYLIGALDEYDPNNFIYTFNLQFSTADIIDVRNYIRIEDLYDINQDTTSYGYLTDNPTVHLYFLAQYDNAIEDRFRRSDLDQYVPGLTGWTVCNMYSIEGGINFFYNYSNIITSKLSVQKDELDTEYFIMKGVPLIKADYVTSETKMEYFIQNLESKRNYIYYALDLLEDSFGIDFKFYNTYGPSKTFLIDGINLLDKVNITFNFDVALLSNADKYIPDKIVLDIKAYIENLNNISSIHISNLITEITNNYKDSIGFIEFTGVNSYPVANQYFERIESTDVAIVPEFLNINSKEDFTPDINITIV